MIQDWNKIHDKAKEYSWKIKITWIHDANKLTPNPINDLVTIHRTQLTPGLKLKPKFLGPYKVTEVNPHDSYDIERFGIHDGPQQTMIAANHMKLWSA